METLNEEEEDTHAVPGTLRAFAYRMTDRMRVQAFVGVRGYGSGVMIDVEKIRLTCGTKIQPGELAWHPRETKP